MQNSKQGMGKGYHLSIEGIRKGYLFRKGFRKKWYVKDKSKGLDLGAAADLHRRASPNKHLLSTSPGGFAFSRFVVYLFSRHLRSNVPFFLYDPRMTVGWDFFFLASQPTAPPLFALPAVVRLWLAWGSLRRTNQLGELEMCNNCTKRADQIKSQWKSIIACDYASTT